MTKTSGRQVRCMTCSNTYNMGKGDHRLCPYCSGNKPMPKPPEKKKSKKAR